MEKSRSLQALIRANVLCCLEGRTREEAARKVYKEKTERYKSAIGLPIELFGWSQRWLEAELALSDTKKNRIAALKAHVDRTREIERMAILYAKTGQGQQADADAATYDHISADIRYFQATGKVPPPPPEVKPRLDPKTKKIKKSDFLDKA